MSRPSTHLKNAPVDTEVSAFRDTEFLVQYPVTEGATCPGCGSGEVYQPMQTMDMPMHLQCLRCGNIFVRVNPRTEYTNAREF